MRWIYEDEWQARHILWEAFESAEWVESGVLDEEGNDVNPAGFLLDSIKYLERTRPEEFTRFVPMGAN